MNRSFAIALSVVTSLLLAGCGDLARVISPAGKTSTEPARVAFTTSVVTSHNRVATDVVALRVTSSYLLAGGARTQIGVQTLSLSSAASQAVPIPIDLASCLADANRESASAGGCQVMLELALTVNDVVVDRQTIGPLRLAPGATAQVSQPISLFEITSVAISPSGDLALTVGNASTLQATLRDSRGGEVAGRTVTWSSNTPTVASVDATGRVTAIAPGEARITASLESSNSSVRVLVSRAPLALRINSLAGSGTGVVRSTPAGIDCRVDAGATSGVCVFDFAADAQVTLTSTADAGQQFGNWGDACVGNAIGAACTLTMTQARTASARFVALRRVQINAASSDGHGRVFGDFGIDCRIDANVATGTCSAMVPEGTPLSLTSVAEAASGGQPAQRFTGWGGACVSQNGPTCTITPAGNDQVISAVFSAPKTVSVNIDGTGGGSVSGSSIACSRSNGVTAGTCSQVEMHGANVVLTAQAAAGATFAGWSGDCSGASTTCTVAMTSTRNVRATFNLSEVTLSVEMKGLGDGTVSVNGAEMCVRHTGQTDAITCSRQFPVGAVVALEAVAGSSAGYEGWSGACTGSSPTCTLTLTQSRAVGATFTTAPPAMLSVGGAGTGTGVVRSADAASLINCTITTGASSGSCRTSMQGNVMLTAQAAAGSTFAGWTGDCAGAALTCTVSMTTARNVQATFTATEATLTVTINGAGEGRLRLDGVELCTRPQGQTAEVICTRRFPVGEMVTLEASPGSGSLSSWSGACSGSTSTCQLILTQSRSVGVTFYPSPTATLTIQGGGTGAGVVRSMESVPFINCAIANGIASGVCSASVPNGTAVTLRSVGSTGSALSAWGGDCAGQASYDCTLTLTTSRGASATFVPAIDVEMRVSGEGFGTVTFEPSGAPRQMPCVTSSPNASASCRFALPTGSTGVFRGIPGGGSTFEGFLGSCAELVGSTPVPVCTYRGIGFLRVFTAVFNK